jgi:hypothetical protein
MSPNEAMFPAVVTRIFMPVIAPASLPAPPAKGEKWQTRSE